MRNWFSGKTAVPYAAQRLIRILALYELPGDAWAGWLMHSGKLWTPEGHPITPADGGWWSLLVRQARMFRAQHGETVQLRKQLQQARDAGLLPRSGDAQRPQLGVQTAGLVSYKTTSQDKSHAWASKNAKVISECYHSASWLQPSDSPPPSKPEQSSTPLTWACPSMPWLPSPWMPTFELAQPLPPLSRIHSKAEYPPPRLSGTTPRNGVSPLAPPQSHPQNGVNPSPRPQLGGKPPNPPNPGASPGAELTPARAGRKAARAPSLQTAWGGL